MFFRFFLLRIMQKCYWFLVQIIKFSINIMKMVNLTDQTNIEKTEKMTAASPIFGQAQIWDMLSDRPPPTQKPTISCKMCRLAIIMKLCCAQIDWDLNAGGKLTFQKSVAKLSDFRLHSATYSRPEMDFKHPISSCLNIYMLILCLYNMKSPLKVILNKNRCANHVYWTVRF